MSNDRIILENVLSKERDRFALTMSESRFFEFYAAEKLLLTYDLSYDEIEQGLVDGGNDGGIDAMYTFANGNLVSEDTDLGILKSDVRIQVIFIQAKTTAGFSDSVVQKLQNSTRELLTLEKPLGDMRRVYSSELLQLAQVFRKTYVDLAVRHPELTIRYYYVTKGDEVHPNVERTAKLLEDQIRSIFIGVNCHFEFVGARQLLDLDKKSRTGSLQLRLAENAISSDDDSFICIVRLGEPNVQLSDGNQVI